MPRLGAWIILLLAGLFLLTTGGTYPGIASVDAHVLGQVIGIAVLGGWLAVSLFRPEWRPRTPLLLPLVVASAAYVASAAVSQRPRLSLEPTIAGLGWALAILFLTQLLARPWFRERVGVLLTAFVAVVAIGYLGQVLVDWVSWWGLVGRFAVPPLRPAFDALFLGSPNLIATALMLLAPLVVVLLLRRGLRWAGVGLAVAATLATFVSGSRGAYAGVAIGLVVGVLLMVARRRATRSSASDLTAAFRRRPILLVPVLAVIVGGAVFAPAVLQRFEQGGADLRFDLWRSALAIFAAHPVLGAGPGTWVQLKVAANPPGVPNPILPHAHDMYVQAAAELGVVGLVALAILAVAVLRRLWAGWRSARWLEAGAVIVSLAAFAGQSIVDNFSNLPFVCLIVASLVAWIDGGLDAGESTSADAAAVKRRRLPSSTALVPLVGLLSMALVVPTLLRIDRAAALAQQGNDEALAGSWQNALTSYDQARATDPGFTLYEIQTASALAHVGRTAESRDLLAHATSDDLLAVNVIGLAALEDVLADREKAIVDVHRAIELGYGQAVVALNAGLIAERIGERDLASDQFAGAVALDPPLAGSNLWTSSARSIPKPDVVAAARQKVDPPTAALIRAYAGDPVGARAELLAMPASDARDLYIPVTTWLGGDADAALAMLAARLDADPGDWLSAAWAARIARLAGRPAEGDVYAHWASAVQGDAAISFINEASVVLPFEDDAWASLPSNYPWSTYLRPDAPFLLMPQLTLIGER